MRRKFPKTEIPRILQMPKKILAHCANCGKSFDITKGSACPFCYKEEK